MSTYSLKKYVSFTVISILCGWLAVGCSSRQTTLQSATNCSAGITTTLIPTSGISSGNATIGSPVIFQVTASGCSGNFVLVRSGYPNQAFSAIGTAPATTSYSTTYSSAASGYYEQVTIKSVDSAGNTLSSAYATSTVFNIVAGTPALSCTVVAQNSSGTVTVDGSNNVVSPASFQFTVSANISAQVRDVSVAGSSTAVSGVPTGFSTTIAISSVPVRQIGSVNVAFSIQDASARTASCNTTVTTTSATAQAAAINSFTSSKPNSTSGDSVIYTINTSNATSATINGTSVTLNGAGVGTLTATTITTGTLTITATATGPGGQASRTLTQTVNPGCVITPQVSSAYKGDNYPFAVTVYGMFQNATISGGGLTSFPLAPPPTSPPYSSTNYSPNVPVQSGNGPGTATLIVTGPNSTSGQCSAPINTVDTTPVITFTFDGQTDSDNVYQSGQAFENVTVAWTSSNAISCTRDGNSISLSGSVTINSGIFGGNSSTFSCTGPTGIKVTKTVTVKP